MRPRKVHIDALALWFYEGLSLPPDQKAIGVPKPLEDREEFIIVVIGDSENLNSDQGGVAQIPSQGENESWWNTTVDLNITVIEPHHYDGYNTYSIMGQAIERVKAEVRGLQLTQRDPDVIDWWMVAQSAPDLGDGRGKQQVMECTLTFMVQWREIWQQAGQ